MATETDVDSPKLQLISHPLCPFVHRAAAMLHEKGVAYDLRFIDLKAKPDWFLAISPRGKVPVLIAEGVPIFESAVILEYLDETQAPRLLPDTALERARQRAWIEVANDLFLAQYKLATAPTAAERDAAVSATVSTLQRFEESVRGPFFAGDTLGLVDLATGPAFVRAVFLQEWLGLELYAGLPKVKAWSQLLAARPSFRDTAVPDLAERYRAIVTRL